MFVNGRACLTNTASSISMSLYSPSSLSFQQLTPIVHAMSVASSPSTLTSNNNPHAHFAGRFPAGITQPITLYKNGNHHVGLSSYDNNNLIEYTTQRFFLVSAHIPSCPFQFDFLMVPLDPTPIQR